jgi:hypothetical protein
MKRGAIEIVVGVDFEAGSEEISDAGKVSVEDCEVQDAGMLAKMGVEVCKEGLV